MRADFFIFQGGARLLSAALLGGVLGCALQLQQSELSAALVYTSIVLLAPAVYALSAIKNAAIVWRVGLAAVAAGLLGFGSTGLRATAYLDTALDPMLEGRDVRVTGVVGKLPQRNESGLRFRLQVESALLEGQPVRLPARVDVGWYGDTAAQVNDTSRLPPPDLRAGERWQMTLRLKAPHGARNPHGFDYELYLWEQGVQATGYVRTSAKDPAPQRMEQTWQYPVVLARQMVRERIYRQVQERAFAGMLAALVLGDQAAIDRLDWDVFRATATAHLISISGLHISMFAWVAVLAVGWLWRRSGRLCIALPAPSAALMGGVLLATAYAVFSGWGVPAQRTCLMLATVALLRLSGARWPWPHVWMLACAVVVASDPWALLQAGFWLSFVAVGILFATNIGAHEIDATGARGIKHHMLSGLRQQWVITVALTPLTLLLFGQVSLVGLVANALAIPWITLVVTPLALLGVVMPALWDVAAGAIGWLYAYLQWLASWQWAAITVAVPPLWAGAVGVLGGALLVLPWGWRMRVLGLPLLLPVLLWRVPLPAVGQFELLAADVGQGNAVLVRTATHALLFDAGPRYSLESDAGHRVLVPLLQALHTRLDTLVLSHRDMDHVGGAPAVLAMQPQAALLSSIEPSHPLQALRTARRCEAGQHWEWDGVRFDVLHPQAADYDTAAKSNAMSCVLRITNGVQTALLAGDIEQPQEARLVAQGVDIRANVLLVPHHGSKTSSSGEFLDAVAPNIAIVQSGYRNRFGHPAPQVLARLQERQIQVVDSPHCGAYTWQSWQAKVGSCLRLGGLRYWHHNVP
ncbi:MAG: DNA internalization-related competence protein ComEC/Rec2 [Pseudomonadota bacterium]